MEDPNSMNRKETLHWIYSFKSLVKDIVIMLNDKALKNYLFVHIYYPLKKVCEVNNNEISKSLKDGYNYGYKIKDKVDRKDTLEWISGFKDMIGEIIFFTQCKSLKTYLYMHIYYVLENIVKHN